MQENARIVAGAVLAALAGAGIFLYGQAPAPSGGGTPFAEIAIGAQSTVAERVNYLITTSGQLEELWKMIDASGAPPAIDFEKDAVIAVFAGQKPTAGYAIAVSRIEDDSLRTVVVALTEPGEGCMSAQVLTAPYQIAVVPAALLPLAHKDISVTAACAN